MRTISKFSLASEKRRPLIDERNDISPFVWYLSRNVSVLFFTSHGLKTLF